jgi:phosphoribosyl 1,2-cyclic phosphate phosphodiesterase
MKITFLGTSAANAFPEPFCHCQHCVQARKLGGPSLRKRAAGLINDDLLIDLGPDVLTAASQHDIPFTNVRYCLQTHAHADHLDTSHFLSRSPGFGVVGAPRLHFYASAGTIQAAAKRLERDCAPYRFGDSELIEQLNLEVHKIEAFKTYDIGSYQIIPFPANHDPFVEPLLYAIQSKDGSIFYGTDTATFPDETWNGIQKHQLRFDLVVLDHTYGSEEIGTDHLSAHQLIEHVARMRTAGLLRENARVFATHIAHEGNPAYPKLAAFADHHGYEIAYDGLTVEIQR